MRSFLMLFLVLLPAGLQGCAGKAADPSPVADGEQQAQQAGEPVFIGTMKMCWGKEACKP